MSATLTPEELGEIAEFGRTNPEFASLLLTAPSPRVALEMIRELKKGKADGGVS